MPAFGFMASYRAGANGLGGVSMARWFSLHWRPFPLGRWTHQGYFYGTPTEVAQMFQRFTAKPKPVYFGAHSQWSLYDHSTGRTYG